MTQIELNEILHKHKLWLDGDENGSKADLSGADLSKADLSGADLSGADLRWANLSKADLSGADLSKADLRWADLRWANLSGANLSEADLSRADLSKADLSRADLSKAKGLLSAVNFIDAHFERTADGYIAYKTFNSTYKAPDNWKIEKGAIIEEVVNFDRCTECGCGINVAPLEWVKQHMNGEIWKVLIRWEWLCGVCVPYMSDGKIRCEKVELVEVVR